MAGASQQVSLPYDGTVLEVGAHTLALSRQRAKTAQYTSGQRPVTFRALPSCVPVHYTSPSLISSLTYFGADTRGCPREGDRHEFDRVFAQRNTARNSRRGWNR
jgi:hypothetical protein